jgi:hypothetical protein
VIADADRLPPPVLFECRTYDNDRYLSDDGNPPPRCYRMTTTGLGGLSAGGAGEACEMKTDQCQRVADGALCDGWRERLRMAESTLRFGSSDNRETAQAEVERIGRIVRESTGGMSGGSRPANALLRTSQRADFQRRNAAACQATCSPMKLAMK